MSPRPRTGLVAAACLVLSGLPLVAQELPEIHDVYGTTRELAPLGPETTPDGLVEDYAGLLGRARTVQYDVRVEQVGAWDRAMSPAWGSVVMTAPRTGSAGRYRVTLSVTTEGDGVSSLVVVGDGRRHLVLDMRRRTARVLEDLGDEPRIEQLVQPLLLFDPRTMGSGGGVRSIGTESVDGAGCRQLHWVDEGRSRHLYLWLAERDGLPRRIASVDADGSGHARSVRVELTRLTLDPPLTERDFSTQPPPGFRPG